MTAYSFSSVSSLLASFCHSVLSLCRVSWMFSFTSSSLQAAHMTSNAWSTFSRTSLSDVSDRMEATSWHQPWCTIALNSGILWRIRKNAQCQKNENNSQRLKEEQSIRVNQCPQLQLATWSTESKLDEGLKEISMRRTSFSQITLLSLPCRITVIKCLAWDMYCTVKVAAYFTA